MSAQFCCRHVTISRLSSIATGWEVGFPNVMVAARCRPSAPGVAGRMRGVRISAKADYAIRATVELAAAGDGPLKGERIAQAQAIPIKFLENIMVDLRHAGPRAQPARGGGRVLARAAGRRDQPRRRDPRGRRPARERPRHAVGGALVRRLGRAAARGVDRRAREPAQRARVGHARRRRPQRAAGLGRARSRPRRTPGSRTDPRSACRIGRGTRYT